jgi:phage shock protein A
MKPGRLIAIVVIVVVAGILVWRFLPGLRHRARDAYERYGGWTPEARRADPVGFLEYAEKKLQADLDELKQSRQSLADAARRLEAERQSNENLLASAGKLANSFRAAYQAAESGGSWPVSVAGATYTHEQLVSQVRLVLSQKANYEKVLKEIDKASEAVKTKSEHLVSQINETKATLAILPAKKEIARVNKLTEDIEELLGEVDELLGENEEALAASPIRTVEELTRAKPGTATPSTSLDADVKAFLEGGG